ncbi:MAG: energy-coupling factor transporter transmembrane protein EcfT [Cellulomonas sp.]
MTTPQRERGRSVHPLAWWGWALGIAVALTRITAPATVALMLAATVLVVVVRRDDSPWARAFGAYLVLGVVVVLARVAFYVVFGLKTGGPVLLDLPSVPLPSWAAGVALLGPVVLTGLRDAAYGGLRLAALIVCFGAANALANPKRALRCLPASLDRMGTAVVIAVTVSPQLVTSLARVRRAQRLRGLDVHGVRGALTGALPVLQDGFDGALALAASMDSRGYARSTPERSDPRVTAALLVALLAATIGAYGLLDATSPAWLGAPLLVVGAVVAVGGSVLAGRRSRRTRYRPDPWRLQETVVAGCGAATALVVLTSSSIVTASAAGAAACALVVALPSALAPAGPTGWWR